MRSIRVILSYLSTTLSKGVVFRSSTLMGLLTSALVVIVTLIFFEAIYSRFNTIAGWSKGEALLLAGVILFLMRLEQGLTRAGLTNLPHFVEMGELEYLLVKPVNVPLLIIFYQPDISFIPRILGGVFLIIYGLLNAGVSIHPLHVLLFLVSVFLSFVLFVTLSFMLNTLSFWILRLYSLYWIIYDIVDLGKYPGEIYSKFLRFFLLSFLPLLILGNFPSRIILNKASPIIIIYQLSVVIFFLLMANFLWKKGLKRYEGAGM